jgi:hypothetical protein
MRRIGGLNQKCVALAVLCLSVLSAACGGSKSSTNQGSATPRSTQAGGVDAAWVDSPDLSDDPDRQDEVVGSLALPSAPDPTGPIVGVVASGEITAKAPGPEPTPPDPCSLLSPRVLEKALGTGSPPSHGFTGSEVCAWTDAADEARLWIHVLRVDDSGKGDAFAGSNFKATTLGGVAAHYGDPNRQTSTAFVERPGFELIVSLAARRPISADARRSAIDAAVKELVEAVR